MTKRVRYFDGERYHWGFDDPAKVTEVEKRFRCFSPGA